jgi:hypothetical protein
VVVGGWRAWTASSRLASRAALLADSRPAHVADADLGDKNAGASSLRLPSGVVVTMKRDTRFHVSDAPVLSDAREEVVVESGWVQAEVPKLAAGHVFAVRTPDALVTVHGTLFSVEVTNAGPTATTVTKVAVTHGVVSVLHGDREVLLYAGMEWSSSGELPASVAPSAISPPSRASVDQRRHGAPTATREVSAAPATRQVGTTPKAETRDLGNQNALFSEAKLARVRGDDARAVSLLNELVQRYPTSPLAEDARVETFRALVQMGDHAGASREARLYLALYPDGFARDEARSLATNF